MTVRIIEGFDLWATSAACRTEILRRWSGANTSIVSTGPIVGTGRFHGQSFVAEATVQTLHSRDLTEDPEWVVGLGLSLKNTPVGTGFRIRWLLSGVSQVEVRVKTSNTSTTTLAFYRGATEIGTPLVLNATADVNTWYYMEFRVKIHGTTGQVEIYKDGVQQSIDTGLNTQNTGAGGANSVDLTLQDDGSNWTAVDDVFVLDSTGTVNGFLGDQTVEELQAHGDHLPYADWTPKTGPSRFSEIDENVADDGTSYIEAGTDGDENTFQFDDLQTIAVAVTAVEIEMQAAVASWGNRLMKALLYKNAELVEGPVEHAVNATGYEAFWQMWEEDPQVESAWTPNAVNDSMVGVKRTG